MLKIKIHGPQVGRQGSRQECRKWKWKNEQTNKSAEFNYSSTHRKKYISNKKNIKNQMFSFKNLDAEGDGVLWMYLEENVNTSGICIS